MRSYKKFFIKVDDYALDPVLEGIYLYVMVVSLSNPMKRSYCYVNNKGNVSILDSTFHKEELNGIIEVISGYESILRRGARKR